MKKKPIPGSKRNRSPGARLGRSHSRKYILIERVAGLLELSQIDARRSVRTVLQSLRNRLPHDVLVAFWKKLPPLPFGIYFEGWQPSDVPLRTSLRQFVTEIQKQLPRACKTEPISAIRAVLTAVREQIGSRQIDEVKRALPQEMHNFFDAFPTAIHPCVEAR